MKKGLWRARQGCNVVAITDPWFGYRSRSSTERASVSHQGLANQNGPMKRANAVTGPEHHAIGARHA